MFFLTFSYFLLNVFSLLIVVLMSTELSVFTHSCLGTDSFLQLTVSVFFGPQLLPTCTLVASLPLVGLTQVGLCLNQSIGALWGHESPRVGVAGYHSVRDIVICGIWFAVADHWSCCLFVSGNSLTLFIILNIIYMTYELSHQFPRV
jgi:hypothetical protein